MRWKALYSSLISALVVGGGCAHPYHDGMREMAQSPEDRLIGLMVDARSSHQALADNLSRMFDKAAALSGMSPAKAGDDPRRLGVAINRVELDKWNRSRDVLAVSDVAEPLLDNPRTHAAANGHPASVPIESFHEVYQAMFESVAIGEEKLTSLLVKMRAHVEIITAALNDQSDGLLPAMPDSLYEKWETLDEHNQYVNDRINALLELLQHCKLS